MRSRDFEKTIPEHVSKNYCDQTWTAGRGRGTNSSQTNLKYIESVIIENNVTLVQHRT